MVYVQLVTYATRRRTEQAHAGWREDEEEAEVTEEELRSEMKKNPAGSRRGREIGKGHVRRPCGVRDDQCSVYGRSRAKKKFCRQK